MILAVKPGVLFTRISPAGFRMLSALEVVARSLPAGLTITSACDGAHSGPDDPHHRGDAYDVRSHGVADPTYLITSVLQLLCSPNALDLPQALPDFPTGQVTDRFFMFLEDAGLPNEHFHLQLRRGRRYP